MSTSVPPQASNGTSQFCGYCHQKPRFANHVYCSKTCASQAATLCNHCHKKPKFQGFDFCGKNCAAQANPGGKATARNGGPATAATQPNTSGFAGGKRGANAMSQQQGVPAFDPVQLAKLVVQHIPQVTQAIMGPNGASGGSTVAGQVMSGHTQANSLLGAHQNVNGGTYSTASSKPPLASQPKLVVSTGSNSQQNTDNLECLIPGCRKPVHTDAKGVKTSDYCSLRHREEAVTTGLRSPCIMCLSYPQTESDYFCSRACREESMNKFLDIDGEDSETTIVSDSEKE
ncbi:hypothetical protein CPB83DRAFT_417424 [Crepidotus variabilis]|uniref:Uncharacterized protein n=1 Tax=Crepidotus variabilis TaxID=179855 RepID=A0A9P6ERK5_9AGAR|nr:hypothetical protein CPB83DRAFT_417424 [Crepidotus variabilis]